MSEDLTLEQISNKAAEASMAVSKRQNEPPEIADRANLLSHLVIHVQRLEREIAKAQR